MEAPHADQSRALAPPPVHHAPPVPGRPVWPVVVGVVSMVEAGRKGLMLVGMVIQMAYAFVLGSMSGGPLGGLFGGSLWETVQAANYVLHPLTAVLLMVGGFLLCRRSRLAKPLLIVYAVSAIVLSTAFPILFTITSQAQSRMLFLLWPIWNATTNLIYPVFLLVWFNRRKIRAQTRSWIK